MLDRYDVRRLQKAAREKDTKYIREWGEDIAKRTQVVLERQYDEKYDEILGREIETILVAVIYTLYFSEETKLRDGAMQSFVEDILATFDCIRTGEYTPAEFREQLEKTGIELELEYDYAKVHRDKLNELDEKIKEYDVLNAELRERLMENGPIASKTTFKSKI